MKINKTHNEILNYEEFVYELNKQISNHKKVPKKQWNIDSLKYLNGLASEQVRKLINIETRRNDGIFFTESNLAENILKSLEFPIRENMKVYDPACGAGNLLISIMNYVYEVRGEKKMNLSCYGTDIHKSFIKASQARLKINSIRMGLKNDFKSSFKCMSGLPLNEFYSDATHIFVNPPFNMQESENNCTWGSGKVNNAAIFIEKIIENIKPATTICAILPDVLRSGTRYSRWRAMVNRFCIIEKIVLHGQFDIYTDVDVFAIKLTKRNAAVSNIKENFELQNNTDSDYKKIEDSFDICVGSVVDNRDPKKGIERGYIVSRGLPNWSIFDSPDNFRKYNGKAIEPPFVVIKRTSRMNDENRANATIINTKSPVYVDNHLIVLKPKTGLLSDCKKILKILKNNKTNVWLNEAIRCRHLTVKIVSKIPIWQ